ncbi:hypothetical protein P20652_1741 [Pseudoalteromonas sp. BSi20652]|uniref:hypothetical protein n=1 Tax=Pseudoalteromonas sp. BSi20652 TaxID=388384 RepID=UPI0002317B26|nr:hypothetical protein [Pseudoalteromonas sp. BSi20652]GAA59877.1 hypothetical protein P20652_1741 [Pseudoalteromonas sp. BSi20652]
MFKLNLDKAYKLEQFHLDWGKDHIKKRVSEQKVDFMFEVENAYYCQLIRSTKDSVIDKSLRTFLIGKPSDLRKVHEQLPNFFKDCLQINKITPSIHQTINFKSNYKLTSGRSLSTGKEIETEVAKVISRMHKIFDYKYFVSTQAQKRNLLIDDINAVKTENWSAYQLAYHLSNRACCYCNKQFTLTINNKTGKLRPQLDHFYPQSKYPFFSLSMYNLIPSCSSCNSSSKGDMDTLDKQYGNTILHPFEDELPKNITFSLAKNKDFYIKLSNGNLEVSDFSIEMKNLESCSKSKLAVEKFNINEQYKLHREEICDALNNSIFYNKMAMKNVAKLLNIKDVKVEAAAREFSSIQLQKNIANDPKQRVLGKLMNDVLKEEFSNLLK